MKSARCKFFAVFSAACFGATPFLFAADEWRQFRHDEWRTGAIGYELHNESWSYPFADPRQDQTFQRVWKQEFPEWTHENAPPLLADGNIYLGLMDGTIRAIDATAANYTEKWVVNTGSSLNNSPAAYDGRIYLVNLHGRVMALNATTGATVWEYTVPTDVYSSILYINGRIYFGGIDGVLYCFDGASGGGGPVWTFATPYGMIDTSPAYHSGKIIFSSENMHAYALDWQSGSKIWDVSLPGDKTWNGSPVVASDANRVVFQTLSTYTPGPSTGGSTYREICGNCAGHYDVGYSADADLPCLQQSDTFFQANRPWVSETTVLDTNTGQEVTGYTYSGQPVNILPFTSMYWNSIRWCVINHRTLYAETFRRPWTVDLITKTISRLDTYSNGGAGPYSYYARGDENVLPVVSGQRIIGAIRKNMAAINIQNGSRNQLQGDFNAGDTSDSTHMDARTYSTPHFQNHPGDGSTGENSELIPYRDSVYYFSNGWLYRLKPSFGSVIDTMANATPPAAPKNLRTR